MRGLLCCGAKHVLWKAEEKWNRGWGLAFGGENDNEYVLRGMMWADNYWLFFDNKQRLVCMVIHIIAEVLHLNMAKPESLWWTSTHKDEDTATLRVEAEGNLGTCPSVRCSMSWATVSTVTGTGFKAQNGRCAKVWAAGVTIGTSIVQSVYL